MAAIDFPASPADGQVFSATNGVVYRYSTAYTAWLAQSPPPVLGGTGDFCALLPGPSALVAGGAVATTMPVVSGNSGGWYVPATGRWTPPAGRYVVYASMYSGGAAGASTMVVQIQKNGTVIQSNQETVAGSSWANPTAQITVDANGADYFNMAIAGGASGNNGLNITFGAFPLTGMQGPTGGPPGPVVGDFFATYSGTIPAAAQTILFPTIVTGNSGAYYNPANGRYTPPAGRYRIQACLAGSPSAAAATNGCVLRKNGTTVQTGISSAAIANVWAEAFVDGIFDANGTDWFDIQNYGGSLWDRVGATSWFCAFPIQGMVGPQGPPGFTANSLYLYSEQVLTVAGTTMTVSFPVGAKRVELDFWFTTSPLTNPSSLILQGMNGASPVATATYNYMDAYIRDTGTVGGALVSNAAAYPLGGFAQMHGKITFIRPDAGYGMLDAEGLVTSGQRYRWMTAYEGVFAAGSFTGYRITAGGVNLAVGSFLRCYVVT